MLHEQLSRNNLEILSTLAQGPYSQLYHAKTSSAREVVLKVWPIAHIRAESQRKAIEQELQALMDLQHRNILPLLSFSVADLEVSLISPYIRHGSLQKRFLSDFLKPLPFEQAGKILGQIGQALQAAHQQQIAHGNLTPYNILFETLDNAVLTDFRVHSLLSTFTGDAGETRTLRWYMAPEQFHGTVNAKTDQYSLGCLAYQLLTGRVPFVGTARATLQKKHETMPPDKLDMLVPVAPEQAVTIEQAIFKAMAKKPEDRHEDIRAFLAALNIVSNDIATANTAHMAVLAPEVLESPVVDSDRVATLAPEIAEDFNQVPSEATDAQLPSIASPIEKAEAEEAIDEADVDITDSSLPTINTELAAREALSETPTQVFQAPLVPADTNVQEPEEVEEAVYNAEPVPPDGGFQEPEEAVYSIAAFIPPAQTEATFFPQNGAAYGSSAPSFYHVAPAEPLPSANIPQNTGRPIRPLLAMALIILVMLVVGSYLIFTPDATGTKTAHQASGGQALLGSGTTSAGSTAGGTLPGTTTAGHSVPVRSLVMTTPTADQSTDATTTTTQPSPTIAASPTSSDQQPTATPTSQGTHHHPTPTPTPTPVPQPTPTPIPQPTDTPTPVPQPTPTPIPQPTPTPTSPFPGGPALQPVAECITSTGGTGFIAQFGYVNNTGNPIQVAQGPHNLLFPLYLNGVQPSTFVPGNQTFIFQVRSNGTSVIWFLNGMSAVASLRTRAC